MPRKIQLRTSVTTRTCRKGTQDPDEPETFDAGKHALIAIYPNPLNPKRYVVLNSSFTFRDFAYLNNARQTPKLPDWAVIDLSVAPDALWPGKVAAADFFDESWRLKPKRSSPRD